MPRQFSLLLCLGAALIVSGCGEEAPPETKVETGAVVLEDPHRWDLSGIFPDEAAWEVSYARTDALSEQAASCQGRLGESGETLAGCLEAFSDLMKAVYRLYAYAQLLSDEDATDAENLALKQRADVLFARASETVSYIQPEIQSLGASQVEALTEQAPRLKAYAHFLDDILRRAPHTLSTEGEQLLAMAALVREAPQSFYTILANADMPWPTVTLSDGRELVLDQAGYTKARQAENREDRRQVFDAFWGTWDRYERTLGVALYSQLQSDRFIARARSFEGSLAASLNHDHIPPVVYETMVAETNAHLDTLHRYFRLRARLLGVDQMAYYDIYPPLVQGTGAYPIDQAKTLVLSSVAVLGDEYVNAMRRGFDQRWMDVYPRPGKKSGAYMMGAAFDVHPFVLMNYHDDYESVSTLAHEWGHALHSYLANQHQNFLNAQYATFLAEVASTFNEDLLLDHMLTQAKDDRERLFYLGSALENLRGTFFRQAMFAEFEKVVHDRVDGGESLTGADFTQIYLDLLRRYHGHDQGVVTIDEAYGIEWAYIPHFYYNFYVYQYATSIAAAALLAEDVRANGPAAREKYLDLLRAGGSDYPYELLRRAGVDMASPAPYRALFARMNRIMDEIESIL
ncbi:MAG: oligoendopeptidase F [Pseudomonadota bacterium]|nr:oligoendopeptidase F [Pseudomonadota bacterium]